MATLATTAMAIATATTVLAGPRVSAAADVPGNEAAAHAHVRSTNATIVALIRQARERSATFRSLVAAIDASDSIIFVEAGKCGYGVRACFLSVSATKSNRYMRIVIDTHRADRELIAAIGHELRHVLEVIAEPRVRNDAAKYFFYERIAMHLPGGAYETVAARDAGNAVLWEIKRFDRRSRAQ